MHFKHLVLYACLLLTFIYASIPLNVFATNFDFYSANDILFYDPGMCPTPSSSNTVLIGNDNTEKILRFSVSKGLTLAQASGIAGNLWQESRFNPAVIGGGGIVPDNYVPVDGTGFGLAMWTFDATQKPLEALAKSSDRKVTDLSLQLDFLWQDLITRPTAGLAALEATTTPEDAAVVFHNNYERSADTPEKVLKVRGGNARIFFNQASSDIPDGTSATTTDTSNCSGNGQPSQYINGFAIYNQYDKQWANNNYGSSTIWQSGCGPSAMAMIITALTGNIVTPADTVAFANEHDVNTTKEADKYYVPGSGSSWTIASAMSKNWGLKATNIPADVTQINTALRAGGLIITSGKGVSPFTGDGHYIIIRAVTADGSWLIGDSNNTKGAENSKIEWDPAKLIENGLAKANVWVITK